MAKDLGIQSQKDEDTNKWYTELITKGNLIEYTDVSGCYILRPKAQFMWDTIREYIDKLIKEDGVQNASFPLFIQESLLLKEQEHVEGFAPEVAWVTHAGDTKLNEKLAIRPTSETIMYAAYAKWIRSYNDLPLRLNQWCNIVRWEFKHPQPFLRSREFFWQEGHTVFETADEAKKETKDILLNIYKKTYEDLLAVPCLVGYKSDKEKFAGAEYSMSCEVYLPIGKAIQGCTTHFLGQNFSKAFGIKFMTKDEKEDYGYQNSWGFTTRSIGVAIMAHSDSKGLVIPPKIAQNKIVIIPITKKENEKEVIEFSDNLAKELKEFSPYVDKRNKSFGFKLNDAELGGYPIRLEIGGKEIESKEVVLTRRDTLEKTKIKLTDIKKTIKKTLEDIHINLFKKAKKLLEENIVEEYSDLNKIIKYVKAGKIVRTCYDGTIETEDILKDKTTGKTLVIPFEEEDVSKLKCPFSNNSAKHIVYVAKSL